MKKFALTSMVAIMAVSPSFAVPTNTSATFPQNGYMLEDYTYTNAATSTNMAGVYEDSVNADANYDNCPAGYWCDASGQHACSTAGDGSYTSSAAGANENTACYKSCTVANANIAHATAVTGNDYYGAGTDTCSATSCENGYHVYSLNLVTEIGTVAGAYGYINPSGTQSNASTFELTENGTLAVTYGNNKGTIKGRAQCSSQSGTYGKTDASAYTTSATLPDNTGQYCWCTVDEYTPVGGAPMSLSGPWVFVTDLGSASYCAGWCADSCAYGLGHANSDGLAYRSAVLGSRTGGAATCEANVITINWSGASPLDIDANNAFTVTYGGDIRTPRAATIIPGKVFTGWTFSAPEPDVGEIH